MKSIVFLLALSFLSLLTLRAPARPRTDDPGQELFRKANTPAAHQLAEATLRQQPSAFLNEGRYEAGCLHLLSGRRVPVVGLRYHVGQRLVQVQDSLQPDSTSFWPLAALRGFDLGTEEEPTTLRRYRAHLVQQERRAPRHEAVQVLTATDAGPLLLGWLPVLLPGTQSPAQLLLAGAGRDTAQPLRPLDPRDAAVLRLLGTRASRVQAFALNNNLHYGAPQEVAQMLNYYNQLAVAVW